MPEEQGNGLSLDDVLSKKRVIKVVGEDVVIDPGRLKFNEATLNRFIEEEAGWYDYYGQRLAEAEGELQFREYKWEVKFAEKFAAFKEAGGSDRLAEAQAKADVEVAASREAVIAAKQRVKILQQHLRSWDKCHENAQSRGHFLRKEIDKLNADIFHARDHGLDSRVEEIIGSCGGNSHG